jgi:Ras GTPase-activating-like protein IQGAP2/3
MLQNLANKPSYAKEAYMMSLNPFVDNNKTRMNLFLNSLCDVGDFYDTLEVSNELQALTRESRADRIDRRADGSVHGVV